MLHSIIDKLKTDKTLSDNEFLRLLTECDDNALQYIRELARETALEHFGNYIYIRGLIELTNYCKNDCYYCGIRRSNRKVERYRLDLEQILSCCEQGYAVGFRTFVMQGGEDTAIKDADIARYVKEIKTHYPDCAITLSLGERSEEVYRSFYEAGADRYLLRHETADSEHYGLLHPAKMSLEHRLNCLHILKKIGFQTGTGIMIGTPGQTTTHLLKDIRFIEGLQPQMIGMGPFLSHCDTPFAHEPNGSLKLSLLMLSIFRLMHPKALIPSTTALATLDPQGREAGILSGANVVMPNLSPVTERKKYSLYNNKAALGAESAEGLAKLEQQLQRIGYRISYERGDFRK